MFSQGDFKPYLSGSGLTLCLISSPKSESDDSVTKAARQVLCCPLANRPALGHVQEDCRLLQMMQNPLSLLWTERFDEGTSGHGLEYTLIIVSCDRVGTDKTDNTPFYSG